MAGTNQVVTLEVVSLFVVDLICLAYPMLDYRVGDIKL